MRPTGRRLAWMALFALLAMLAPLQAQSPGAASDAIGVAQPGAPPAAEADPWGFDEPTAETWIDVIRPQVLGLALLTGFLALALTSFFLKSVPLKYVTLAAAVGYMGFVRSQLLSVVDIFGLISWNLPIVKHNVAWYVLSVFTVVATLLWGRLYCGRICAFGALTQLMDTIVPARLRVELPATIERPATLLKYVALAGVVVYFLATEDMMVYRFVEPFWLFGLVGTTGMWIGLGTLLAATLFIRNLYCRFLCPVGATLSLLAVVPVFPVARWSECGTCKICERACQWNTIRGSKIVMRDCMRCDDCERLSRDEQQCPHWLLLKKRAEKAAS